MWLQKLLNLFWREDELKSILEKLKELDRRIKEDTRKLEERPIREEGIKIGKK